VDESGPQQERTYASRVPDKVKRLPNLPPLFQQKLTKTGYTRGAALKEIYQNRVTRNNPVLIPWEFWEQCKEPGAGEPTYEKGFIALIEPSWYFDDMEPDEQLRAQGLELGVNALLVYRRRVDWRQLRPSGPRLPNGKLFRVATSRSDPLGGVYLARVHATVADDDEVLIEGFNTSRLRGAGIRVYEYASSETIRLARLQLEALLWLCEDAQEAMVAAGMSHEDADARGTRQLAAAEEEGLLDMERLLTLRVIGASGETVCPLCLVPVHAADFSKRSEQAQGRVTFDITTTDVSLFHIQELRVGTLQHKPYNLGWGHHFCNVVTRDAGIMGTLDWMKGVLENQGAGNLDARSVEEAVGD
jgi:hypothetical protein